MKNFLQKEGTRSVLASLISILIGLVAGSVLILIVGLTTKGLGLQSAWEGNADAVPQPPERCLSRKAGIVRCCLSLWFSARACRTWWPGGCQCFAAPVPAQPAAQLQKFPAPGYSGSSHS